MTFSETDFFFKMREGLWKNFYSYPEVNSTNIVAEQFITKGVSSGIVMADTQTFGRGRLDHSWESSSLENIYISFFGKCGSIDTLPLATAVAVKMTADCFTENCTAVLKWPNDLLVDGGKCAGFLGKTMIHKTTQFYIAGIGFNVKKPEIDVFPLKPSGLQEISSISLDKKEVAIKLKENFEFALTLKKDVLLEKVKNYFAWMVNRKTTVSSDGKIWEDAVIKGFTDDISAIVLEKRGELLTTAAISIGEIV